MTSTTEYQDWNAGPQPLPTEVWLLRVKWRRGLKPKNAKGGGVFRTKHQALARRNRLARMYPEELERATLHWSPVEWQEYTDWLDPDLRLPIPN